jgi:hypothetical protein
MNDIEKLKEFLLKKIDEYKSEADCSGIFSGSYWSGKAESMAEVLAYLEGNND